MMKKMPLYKKENIVLTITYNHYEQSINSN